MRARWLLGFMVLFVLGCGGGGSKKLAPVSGRVTLDGKPLANAVVIFQPIAEKGSVEGGVSSKGTTNENGEFTLTAENGSTGAAVGQHRVSFSSQSQGVADNSDARKRSGPPMVDKIPRKYDWPEGKEAKSFDVPSGGTDKANFDLTSR
jgi:hypothetical protein